MLLAWVTLYHHIVHVYLDVTTNEITEYYVHKSLICGIYVFRVKRHNFIIIVNLVLHESCLFFCLSGAFRSSHNWSMHRGNLWWSYRSPRILIDLCSGRDKRPWGKLYSICVVCANSKFSICFLHHDYICEPRRVLRFSYKVDIQQFLSIFPRCLSLLFP